MIKIENSKKTMCKGQVVKTKCKKHYMSEQIVKTLLMLILVTFLISNISAVEYFSQKYFRGNDTTQVHTLVFWDFGGVPEDNIKSGNPLETYVWYNIYPTSWNIDNPNYAVEYCNLSIKFFNHLDNFSTTLYEKTYLGDGNDEINNRFFVKMYKGDLYFVDVFCKFENNRPELLELPATHTIVTPTWECKECQYYEWSVLEQDIEKAKTLGDNKLEVVSFMKGLILLNFEIIIAVFWMILIGVSFIGTSLIFVGVYWVWIFLRKVTEKGF